MKKCTKLILAATTMVTLGAFTGLAANAEENTVKAGFIFLHDENSTYDLNFINAAKEACDKMGIEYVFKTGIPEGQECYEAACELADAGCNFVFADSFGHEDYIIGGSKRVPGCSVLPCDRYKGTYGGDGQLPQCICFYL